MSEPFPLEASPLELTQERQGFREVWLGVHRYFGIDEATLYLQFTPEVIAVSRRTIAADHRTAS